MLNILQIPNKLYLAEHFVQTICDSMNQGIGTYNTENWRRKEGGGGHMMFLIKGGGTKGGGTKGGTFKWGS